MRPAAILTILLIASACSDTPTPSDGAEAWVGTITTEGDVTTVVTEAGSVWRGRATLVEHASIGVDAGDEHYMLANVASIAVSEDKIFVLETSPPVIRVYDLNGIHIRDIGTRGEGPSEFASPMSMVATRDDNVLVRDDRNNRVSVFSPDGDLLDTWSLPGGGMTSAASVATADGTVYLPQIVGRDPETGRAEFGMVPYDGTGARGEPIETPALDYVVPELPEVVTIRPGGGRSIARIPIPLYPRPVTFVSPVGAWVVGIGDRYRFEVRYFDRRTLAVERAIQPVAVSSEEAAWRRRRVTVSMRRRDPAWVWSGPDVPDHKPFFDQLHADYSGRVWVHRMGPSEPVEDCDQYLDIDKPAERTSPPVSCWRAAPIVDVFGADGRYLGEVDYPRSVIGFGDPYIRDDLVVLQTQDDAGTVMVKRYRLVLPDQAGPAEARR